MDFHASLSFLTGLETTMKANKQRLEEEVAEHEAELQHIATIKVIVIQAAAANNIVVSPNNFVGSSKEPEAKNEAYVNTAFNTYQHLEAGTSSHKGTYQDPIVRSYLIMKPSQQPALPPSAKPYNKHKNGSKRTNPGASKRSFTAGYRAALAK